MKKIISVLVLALFFSAGFAQTNMSCCIPSATEKFALNASDKSFIMSHEEPLPFVFTSARGADITYKTTDGTDAHAWEIKAKSKTDYCLFVIHEWWGLNDYIKQESEKLSDDLGVNVIALDLYDKQVATTREDAGKYMQSVKPARATAIIKGAYAYAGSSAKVFTM